VLTATLSARTVAELSEQAWVRQLKLSRTLLRGPDSASRDHNLPEGRGRGIRLRPAHQQSAQALHHGPACEGGMAAALDHGVGVEGSH
jgi:hypothetical protein